MNNTNINHEIVNKLNSLNLTISTCEHITGGLVSNNLVQVENSDLVFKGGLVVFNQDTIIKLAKVSKDTIEQYGCFSKQTATAMAVGCQKKFNTDIAVSTLGNIGDEMYISVRMFDTSYNFKFESKYDNRPDIINECVAFTLFNVLEMIKDLKK